MTAWVKPCATASRLCHKSSYPARNYLMNNLVIMRHVHNTGKAALWVSLQQLVGLTQVCGVVYLTRRRYVGIASRAPNPF